MDKFAKQAMDECNGGEKTPRIGGVNQKAFWNVNSSQFMYVPSFCFPKIPSTKEYIFTAFDSKGNTHSFVADEPTALLTPIWKDIAQGVTELKVEAVNANDGKKYVAGTRTFFKCAPFPGRENLPPKATSYKDAATMAFKYVFNDETTRYWLTHGVPKPDYYHNVYPSKTISSIVNAMIAYSKLNESDSKDAMKIATNAADYLISITYDENSKLAGLPPTYSFKGLIKEIVDEVAPAADKRKDDVMMIYPATAGLMYLELFHTTGDDKYFKAAEKIAEYYKDNVLPNGSWYLLVSEITGETLSLNYCASFKILEFLNGFHNITKDKCYKELEDKYYEYLVKNRLDNYNWEGQFEDSALSENYRNLTHIDADNMITYIANNLSDDENMMNEAEMLMRFVEDQFVVWDEFAPWSNYGFYGDKSYWYSPAALEQYYWYVPIDGSAAAIIRALLSVYDVTKDELILEKARALGDAITRMQNKENGVIPTHWMIKDCMTNLDNFWINCHIGSAFSLLKLSKYE